MKYKKSIDIAFHQAQSICEQTLIDIATELTADKSDEDKKVPVEVLTETMLARLKEAL